jgi:prepilin-type N-terminal cleavage/methylation domain-containing protein
MRTKNQNGFSLIELLIVIVIILIIAAIAIPRLLRARVSANEARAIGDTRTVLSAQVAYASANGGWFGEITCLATPSTCIPQFSEDAPTFLDLNIGEESVVVGGYARAFTGGSTPTGLPTSVDPESVDAFCYASTPQSQNITGVRGFGGDASGVICFDTQGADLCGSNPRLLADCAPLQ